MRLGNWLQGCISCRFINGATYGAWGPLCSLRTRKMVGKEDLFICFSFCLSLYSYSSLKPNDFSKGFMEAPVQVGTLSPGPPGSGGRRADRVFPGAAPYLRGTTLSHVETDTTTYFHSPGAQIHPFRYSPFHTHVTCVHTRVHSHTQTCTSKTRPPECACMSSCVHTYDNRHSAFSHTRQ